MVVYFICFCSNSFVVVCLVVALELYAQGRAQLGGCCGGRDVFSLPGDADGSGLGLLFADRGWHGGLAWVGGEGGAEQLTRGAATELARLH